MTHGEFDGLYPNAMCSQRQTNYGEKPEREEPTRLPEVCGHGELGLRGRFTPLAVLVTRHHLERVFAGSEIRVIGDAAIAAFDPIGIEANQPIAEVSRFRRTKRRRGVVELKTPRPRRHLD